MSSISPLSGPMVSPAGGAAPTSMVILLHGYGSNGADLIELAPYWRRVMPNAVYLSPNAPEVCPYAPGGYQWWDIQGQDPAGRAAGVRKAAPILNDFIDYHLEHYGLTEDRVVLVGFSQGTMMSLQVGPRRAKQLAGIIGFSGMLADPTTLKAETLTRPPVLLVHGEADQVLPVGAFYEARDGLIADGFEVESHVSPGLGHSIDTIGLEMGATFLQRVLP